MGLLGNVFGVETKARNSGSDGAVARATGTNTVGGGLIASLSGSGSANWDLDKSIRDGYERVIWVYRCVDAIASNQAGIPMILREGDAGPDSKIVEDKQLSLLLNKRPNGYETAFQFRYRLSTQLLLSKKGVFIEIVPARNGRAGALHILPSDKVTPIPDPKTFVSGFKVQMGDDAANFTVLKPEQVIWIRTKPHPTKVFEQVTPLMAAGLAVETDFLARIYNRTFLANNGKPGLLINVKSLLGSNDAEEIKRRFSGGPMSAGQTTVLESDGIDIIDMFSSPADVQWLQAIAGAKEDILLAFGVAESFLGNASGRTFDNADAEFEITWSTTMVPHCNSIASGFDRLTETDNEVTTWDNIEVAFDYTKVEVLQRAERRRHDKLLAEFNAGLITADEYRKGTGKDTFDVPGSQVLWMTGGKVGVGPDDETTAAVAALMPVGSGVPADPSVEAQRGAIMGSQQAQRELGNQASARALSIAGRKVFAIEGSRVTVEADRESGSDSEGDRDIFVGPDNEFRALVEGQVEGILGSWSARQGDVLVDRLDHVKVRKHTRHWDGAPGTKALDPSYVVEMDKWKAEVRRDLEAALTPLAKRQARRAALDLDAAGVVQKMNAKGRGNPKGRSALDRVTLDSDGLVQGVLDRVLGMAEQAAERQSARVVEKINALDAEGKSLPQIKRAVKEMIDSRGSWRKGLAIHASTAMMEGVKTAVYAEAKNLIVRQWNTQTDERVRNSHQKANGQTRVSSRPFRVGGHKMLFPGDPAAPIGETANCRCYLTWTPA